MPKVKIDDLQEGMIVAADVRNIDDMLLLPAGAELTARHLKVLRSWGITEVTVQATHEAEDASDPLRRIPPEALARIEAALREIFYKFEPAQALPQTVFRLMLLRQARRALPHHDPPD
jgi:hypothetical protein